MDGFSGAAVTGIAGIIVLRGWMKGCDVYGVFIKGAEKGMRSAMSLLPALCAMLLMLAMMNASGLTEWLTRLISPVTKLMHLPAEAAPMLLLRPLTGSGSLAALCIHRVHRLLHQPVQMGTAGMAVTKGALHENLRFSKILHGPAHADFQRVVFRRQLPHPLRVQIHKQHLLYNVVIQPWLSFFCLPNRINCIISSLFTKFNHRFSTQQTGGLLQHRKLILQFYGFFLDYSCHSVQISCHIKSILL